MKRTLQNKCQWLVLTLILLISFALVGCNLAQTPSPTPDAPSVQEDQAFRAVYTTYVTYAEEKGETPLSYDEWLATIRGKDGATPTIAIDELGFWVINGVKTTYKAIGQDGADGQDGVTPTVEINEDGFWVINGETTDTKATGASGKDGVSISGVGINELGELIVTFSDGSTSNLGVIPNAGQMHVHTFDEWIYLEEPSCQYPGLAMHACLTCHECVWEMIPPAHNWRPACCIAPKTCYDCGVTEGDIGTEHIWVEANCLSPKHCEVCKITEGDIGDHSYVSGYCTVCSKMDASAGYDGSAVTITFYHTMGFVLRDVLDKYIAEFNELYPNITVEHEQVGGFDDVRDVILNQITVGAQPNLAYCYPDHVASYNVAKATVPLDELIGATATVTRADGTTETLGLTQAQVDDFIDGFYNEGRAFGDGKMYTLPLSKSTEVLYYNVEFFEENNLKVPTTWAEMEEVCKKILEIDPDCIPLGYDSEANWFITMCEQYGSDYTSATGDHFLFNNETNRNFVAMFRDWYQKGYVTTQELYGGYTSDLFTALEGDIDWDGNPAKKCYMSIGSSAGAMHQRPGKVDGKYPFSVGIATIPQVNPAQPKVISQGPSLCLFKDSNPQEVYASWLFMKYLTTCVEFQAEFSMASGYMPVLESVMNNDVYAEFLNRADGGDNVAALSIKVALSQADAYFSTPAFLGSSIARDEVGSLMQRCFLIVGDDVASQIKKIFEQAVEECEYQS